jgi:hypothetical protein
MQYTVCSLYTDSCVLSVSLCVVAACMYVSLTCNNAVQTHPYAACCLLPGVDGTYNCRNLTMRHLQVWGVCHRILGASTPLSSAELCSSANLDMCRVSSSPACIKCMNDAADAQDKLRCVKPCLGVGGAYVDIAGDPTKPLLSLPLPLCHTCTPAASQHLHSPLSCTCMLMQDAFAIPVPPAKLLYANTDAGVHTLCHWLDACTRWLRSCARLVARIPERLWGVIIIAYRGCHRLHQVNVFKHDDVWQWNVHGLLCISDILLQPHQCVAEQPGRLICAVCICVAD